jgi:hypothetical protein
MITEYKLVEAYKMIERLPKRKYQVIRGGRYYDKEELESFIKDLEGGTKTLEGFRIIIKEELSMRRALIVLLQEGYYKLKCYDDVSIDLIQLQNKAKSRFLIGNRDQEALTYPERIHPKNPCARYEYNKTAKMHYKSALKILVIPINIYFIDEKAYQHLKIVYEDVLIC